MKIKTETETETEVQLAEQFKAIWEKPQLEVCQLNQTQNAGGSGGDAGVQTT